MPAQRQATLLHLQRTHGNAYVQRLLRLREAKHERRQSTSATRLNWGAIRANGDGTGSRWVRRSIDSKQVTLFRSAEWATQGKAVQWGKVRHEQPGQANDQQSSQSDKDTIRLRVNRLKDSSRELRKLAEQPIPDSLSRQEALKEKRYSEWLGQTSQELDSLAKEGSSIVKAMTIGKAKGQVSRRSSNPQEAQLLSRRTPSQSWALGSGSNVSSEGDDSNAISIIGNLTSTSSDSTGTLMDATKQMQEMNQSFNLQYLQLQQKMQSDNRQFTLMSNVMKTKHDTAKAAINNVR